MTDLSLLRDRIRRIRLTEKELARLAGIHKDTLAKTLAGRCDTKNSTFAKIERALVAEELRVLAHLQALHGNLPPPAPLEAKSPASATAPVLRQNGAGAFHSEGRAA